MSRTETIQVRLPPVITDEIGKLAKMAGVKPEAVIRVVLAAYVLREQREPQP